MTINHNNDSRKKRLHMHRNCAKEDKDMTREMMKCTLRRMEKCDKNKNNIKKTSQQKEKATNTQNGNNNNNNDNCNDNYYEWTSQEGYSNISKSCYVGGSEYILQWQMENTKGLQTH
ncbi:apicoplast dimethyladenosine synthase [Reticulomyxa filosa]|uniref:Apicoplast dimethyladenosine synthase n=1 Tax=Reticulomyxa filosa TaxID=46433 RepID=X6LM45_RETFI|nr:apicoplast dimethyladenosine synthase [Reticulomyxa filosa]|eukprot:ETO01795.1 apicoplast dimethyladenosine synthase [Reticulomyxa filosa]